MYIKIIGSLKKGRGAEVTSALKDGRMYFVTPEEKAFCDPEADIGQSIHNAQSLGLVSIILDFSE